MKIIPTKKKCEIATCKGKTQAYEYKDYIKYKCLKCGSILTVKKDKEMKNE